MLFIFLNFVFFSSTLVCFENFDLNKIKSPPCHVCGWCTLVCQPHPCSHISQSTQGTTAHRTNGEHQKKLSAVRHRKSRPAKSRPTSIPILQSPATPNKFVTHTSQRTQRNGTLAKRWKIRPPGLFLGCPAPLSVKRQDFSRGVGMQSL